MELRGSAGWTLDVEQTWVDATSNAPRKDPDWSFTDAAGHVHTWESETWQRVLDDPDDDWFYTDEDGEEYNSPSHLECRECGEAVEPGTLPPTGFTEMIPGVINVTLAGYRDGMWIVAHLVPEEYQALREADDIESAVDRMLRAVPSERIISMSTDPQAT